MADFPFGFGPGSGGSGDLPDDIAGKVPLFAELQKLFAWSGGPVNWDLARQLAISAAAGTNGPGPTPRAVAAPGDAAAVAEALRLADLWLDDVTELPSGITSTEAWTRVQWIERTLPVWSTLCDPVASRVVSAMGSAMGGALPEELRAQAGPMDSMMTQLGGMMFGSQVGQALGGLAAEVLSATDIGLPLGAPGVAALVTENMTAFGSELGRPLEEVRLYLALREAAHHRLFGHVPWLRQRLIDTVDAYARGIAIDTAGLETLVSQIDPSNPESIQSALSGGMFEPQETAEQQAALRRLETLLALVEGWVDAVVADVASARLGRADALREASRRRRAGGGPAEQTFATLVGLELRPRKLREASALWAAAERQLGKAERDALWAHPDLLPDSDDLDDPDRFLSRSGKITDESINELLASVPEDPQQDRPESAQASSERPDDHDERESDGDDAGPDHSGS